MPEIITASNPLKDGVLVALTGEIDLSRAPLLRAELMEAIAGSPKRLIIDLSGVPYMDSSGVATLVEVFQRQRKHQGAMYLCAMQPKVKSIFEIARLDSVFKILPDAEAAKSA
jgi:anti-sigma B factor antagonist